MIYTVTFSPSLDYVLTVPELKVGDINRTQEEHIYPGGKGVNVSIVLSHLGLETKALGFTAGFTGKALEAMLADHGVATDFVNIEEGFTRINVKVAVKPETAINGHGPAIGAQHIEALYDKLTALKNGDVLVLAGAIPGSLPNDIYEKILASLEGKGVRTVVDATGELVLKVLKYHPFLIKPNHSELGEFFGDGDVEDPETIVKYAKKLQELGARNVLVSRGGDGAILVDEYGTVTSCPCPKGKLVNSVGAGDSMVAGFLAGYSAHASYEEALKMGISAGSASAFLPWLADKEAIEKIYNTL